MSQYLQNKEKILVTKIIFHTRSKNLEIKIWCPWKFENNFCVACKKEIETMCHFINYRSYQSEPLSEWSKVNINDYIEELEAGAAKGKRSTERTGMIETLAG